METIHVLIVSDNQSEIEQIRDLLSTDSGAMVRYHVESEMDYATALRCLVGNKYDVFLVDQIVPNVRLSGMDLVKKANAGGCRSPVLLLTTIPEEDIGWALDDAGAAGYINKNLDFHDRIFQNAIRTAIRHNQDVMDVRNQLRALQRQVAELIQAFNRRG